MIIGYEFNGGPRMIYPDCTRMVRYYVLWLGMEHPIAMLLSANDG